MILHPLKKQKIDSNKLKKWELNWLVCISIVEAEKMEQRVLTKQSTWQGIALELADNMVTPWKSWI